MIDCVIDLETPSTKTGKAILTIGAVMCHWESQTIISEFYRRIQVQDALNHGLTNGGIDADCLAWWMQQEDEARLEAFVNTPRVSLRVALTDLTSWLVAGTIPYGNGASFDLGGLQYAYEVHNLDIPWEFWDEGCMRTLMRESSTYKSDLPFAGVEHNALDDARHEAQLLMLCKRRIHNKEKR